LIPFFKTSNATVHTTDGPGKTSKIDYLGLYTRIDCTSDARRRLQERLQERLQARLHIAHRVSRCVQFALKELPAGTVWNNEAPYSCLCMDESLLSYYFLTADCSTITKHCTVFWILSGHRVYSSNGAAMDIKHSCPSGLRGSTQVRVYSYSWVQNSTECNTIMLFEFLIVIPFISL
jgi:hypothetical protein